MAVNAQEERERFIDGKRKKHGSKIELSPEEGSG